MPLRSEVGSFGCKANLAMGLVHRTAKAAPIFRRCRERAIRTWRAEDDWRNLPLLQRHVPVAYGAHPQMLSLHRNKGDPKQLEPHARFDADDGSWRAEAVR